MTVVSTKEFTRNQDKYFDMALADHVIIQREDHLFIVQNYIPNDEPDEIFEPDDDFYKSITMDEFLLNAKEDLRGIFRKGKR